ncbi:hypothetical protein [Saccharopolyspora sp. NPDC049357]|uniref:hypothetical protein n=1 Tax=Saccharopolyspora sp. NPDC049357 TaxID=3154507 RepID=UPI003414DD12
MPLDRLNWAQLSPAVHAAVEACTGPIRSARTVSGGKNSAIAAVVDAAGGRVFVKGLHRGHGGVVTQAREAAVAEHVHDVSPRLLWRLADVDGWDLLGIEHVDGRHADIRPGSPDLPAVLDVMRRLGNLTCPDLPELKTPTQRWRKHVDDQAELALFDGSSLLHTDYNPENIIIDGQGRAHLIDWAWPTRGASFIDPCVLAGRLIADGHTPTSAESWISSTPAWTTASSAAIAAFSRANARVWDQIAGADPSAWKTNMAAAARSWADHCAR